MLGFENYVSASADYLIVNPVHNKWETEIGHRYRIQRYDIDIGHRYMM